MGIYDRDWYKEPSHGSGWFGSLHPVARWILVLLIGCIVVLFVMKSWGSRRGMSALPPEFDDGEHPVSVRPGSIHDAAERGDVGRVAQILARDASQVHALLRKNTPDQPLHRAAWADQRGTADLLVRYGADVNARGDQGLTPLHYAAQRGSAEVAELLLKHAADTELKDHKGFTPLLAAARSHNPESRVVARLLLKHGARLDLHSALCLGKVETARDLLQGDPQAVARAAFPDALLSDAIAGLRLRLAHEPQLSSESVLRSIDEVRGVIELILGQGADVNQAGIARVPPLCEAVQLPDESIARCLLEHGADQEVVDSAGRTPRMLARGRAMQDLLRKHARGK